MSLHPQPVGRVPDTTASVARAAFPKGNPYLRLRDELGTLFTDQDFTALFPNKGQPALPPWRLALITIVQFLENLTDRQAADGVRARIDLKYLLGLELTDPGFDFSVLSEFRARLVTEQAERLLLDTLLERFKEKGLVKARGQQRTDSTHVLAAIRVLSRVELAGETLRAALNELAVVDPEWVRDVVPHEWYDRYGRRIEDARLPKGQAARQAHAEQVGDDGFRLLDALDGQESGAALRQLQGVQTVRLVWSQQFKRVEGKVCWRTASELPPARERLDSPHDPDARYANKADFTWVGYRVHVSESCDDDAPHLITHVETTLATVPDINMTQALHQALADKQLTPGVHIVDSGYVDADLLTTTFEAYGLDLIGPARRDKSWQAQTEGAFDFTAFEVHWDERFAICPGGKRTSSWVERPGPLGSPKIHAKFRLKDCGRCPLKASCTRGILRNLSFQPQAVQEALYAARQRETTEEWQRRYHRRAGIEATLSQGVRTFGLRRTRYRGLPKTRLQHAVIGAAINVVRVVDWLSDTPRWQAHLSRFAALKPVA